MKIPFAASNVCNKRGNNNQVCNILHYCLIKIDLCLIAKITLWNEAKRSRRQQASDTSNRWIACFAEKQKKTQWSDWNNSKSLRLKIDGEPAF